MVSRGQPGVDWSPAWSTWSARAATQASRRCSRLAVVERAARIAMEPW